MRNDNPLTAARRDGYLTSRPVDRELARLWHEECTEKKAATVVLVERPTGRAAIAARPAPGDSLDLARRRRVMALIENRRLSAADRGVAIGYESVVRPRSVRTEAMPEDLARGLASALARELSSAGPGPAPKKVFLEEFNS